MNVEAIKDLLYRIADDELIIGHRNSEWTGIGPILEEDIAFSSMAQDEIGHAHSWYNMLNGLFGEKEPDIIAFHRTPEEFRSCYLVEHPITDYAFSLVRHVLYDIAEQVRLESLMKGKFMPIAQLAQKLYREEKYHQLHAETWMRQLGSATEEANTRLQAAIDLALPMAYSLFEPTEYTDALVSEGILDSEADLEKDWLERITKIFQESGLKLPEVADKTQFYGGRSGKHSDHLLSLLKEMTEVFVIDPAAKW